MQKEYQYLIEKVRSVLKYNSLDLSAKEDLAVAVMNLISLEEHLFFTAQKTKEENYYDLLNKVREMRKKFLKKIITKEPKSQEWCISKHLLSATMRLIEVGTKKLNTGNRKEAEEFFESAQNLWSLFWAINLNLVPVNNLNSNRKEKYHYNLSPEQKKENQEKKREQKSFFYKLNKVIQKVLNCCRE